MNTLKKSTISLYIISLAFIFTCFDANRNNPYDPNSPNNPYYGHPIRIDKIGYNFGDVAVGQYSDRVSFNVLSKGGSIYIDRIESSDQAVFQVLTVSPTLPFTMPADGFVNFEVEFHPNVEGQVSETIDVIYTDADGPRISMPVTGNGTAGTIVDNETSSYQFYVSDDYGNNTNAGTADAPFATITRAVEAAQPGDSIAVASGNYTNDGNDIFLAGIELYGGFVDDGMWNEEERDPETNITELADDRTSGGATDNPIAPIIIRGDTANTTVIDGFLIIAGQYATTCSIKIDTDNTNGYSAIISNNKIDRNDIYSPQYTYGIFHSDGSSTSGDFQITIDSNSIYGGDAVGPAMDAYSYGIYLASYTSDNISLNIWNNTIDAGEVNCTTPGIAMSHGIYLDNIPANIFNNTIYMGDAYSSGGSQENGIYFRTSSPSIINNIIFGDNNNSEYGIYEGDAVSDPAAVDNNDFFEINTAFYFDGSYGDLTEIESSEGCIWDGSLLYTKIGNDNKNLQVNFADQSGGDWHLIGSTYEEVRTGGQDLSSYFTTDKDGKTRTGAAGIGWSMGAYEFD